MNDTLSYAPTVDPEAVPQGTERGVAARLRPLLTLPAEALLERLLGEGLDDPDGSEPWVGYASPPSLS